MSKKVLIVEESLAVRDIAESLLRQNGYEVFTAENAAAAGDILHGSKLDLLLVASNIVDQSGRPFYEALGADSTTATLPLLILHDPAQGELAYPPEAIIRKPFTPREFLDVVAIFSGSLHSPITTAEAPFAGSDIEDELIDAALGLDRLEIDEAEVLSDDSGVYRQKNKPSVKEDMVGYEYKSEAENGESPHRHIDRISVPADPKLASEVEPNADLPIIQPPQPTSPSSLSDSSKLEIIPDQFGMTFSEQAKLERGEDGSTVHDYDWFINELQKEKLPVGGFVPGTLDSGPLRISPASEILGPIASVPPSSFSLEPAAKSSEDADEPKTHSEAVDRFISEFKKEMEKLTDVPMPGSQDETEEIEKIKSSLTESSAKRNDILERISPADIRTFSKELVGTVAAIVAERIVTQIDEETVYRILRECFNEALDKTIGNRSSRSENKQGKA